MKRILTILAAGLGLAFASPVVAQADPISVSYCSYSLHGGGSLAPDNDILAMRAHYGSTAEYVWDSEVIDGNDTVIQYRVYGGAVNPSVIVLQWTGCYRWSYDGYKYHDTPAWGGWTY